MNKYHRPENCESLSERIAPVPIGSKVLQEATEAFALLTYANTELNPRRRELIKPDLHNNHKKLYASSIPIYVSCFPLHFFCALSLPACFTTRQSTVEASLFVK